MTSRDFCYWLQGYFEIQQSNTREGVADISPRLDDGQIETIRKHLEMVFVHEIDPSFGADSSKLNKIHDSSKPVARC